MKKLFILCFCLVSSSLFSQKKNTDLVSHNKKTATVRIKIPTNSVEDNLQEFFVKDEMATLLILSFYKDDIDTATCYIDVDYVYPKTKTALLDSLVRTQSASTPSLYPTQFKGEKTPPIAVDESCDYVITFNRYSRTIKYKINFELEPKVYPKGSDID